MTETQDLGALVRSQLEEILGDPLRRGALLGMNPFGADQQDMLDYHDSVIRSLLADRSLGRALSGPLWLSGTSVVDGTITAPKISVNTLEAVTTNTGDLNITGNLVAAAAFPATGARVEINSSGLWGYSGAATTTFKLNTDGSGEIGTGANKVTWTTGGVVAIPAAVISSLTIADIGGGTLGGTYQTNSGSSRIDISTTGIVAYASGIETFRLNGTTGAMTATGSFTVKSAASGARVEISSAGGIAGYNSGGTQTFLLNAAAGNGQLGAGTNSISWDSSGNASIGGVALSSGKITASHLSVSSLSAITANMGTITAGTITGGTIYASAITTGTMNADRISGGSVGGSFNLGSANMTLNSTGAITWASSSSSITSSKISIQNSTYGGALEFKDSGGTLRGSIYCYSSGVDFSGRSGNGGMYVNSTQTLIYDTAQISVSSMGPLYLSGGNVASAVYLYTNGDVDVQLGDAAGARYFYVRDSSGVDQFGVNSNGDLIRPITNDSTALGSYYGRVPIYINGSLKYLGVYN